MQKSQIDVGLIGLAVILKFLQSLDKDIALEKNFACVWGSDSHMNTFCDPVLEFSII